MPRIVSREEWLAARKAFLAEEKAAAKARDRLNEAGIESRILLTSSMVTKVLPGALEQRGVVAFISKSELPTTDLSALLR